MKNKKTIKRVKINKKSNKKTIKRIKINKKSNKNKKTIKKVKINKKSNKNKKTIKRVKINKKSNKNKKYGGSNIIIRKDINTGNDINYNYGKEDKDSSLIQPPLPDWINPTWHSRWTTSIRFIPEHLRYLWGTSIPPQSNDDNIIEKTLAYYMYGKGIRRLISFQSCEDPKLFTIQNHANRGDNNGKSENSSDDDYKWECRGNPTLDKTTNEYKLSNIEGQTWLDLKNKFEVNRDDPSIEYIPILVEDMTPGTLETWSELNMYEDFNSKDKSTIIHCLAGMGRTGSAFLFYILRYFLTKNEESKTLLNKKYLGSANSNVMYENLKDLLSTNIESDCCHIKSKQNLHGTPEEKTFYNKVYENMHPQNINGKSMVNEVFNIGSDRGYYFSPNLLIYRINFMLLFSSLNDEKEIMELYLYKTWKKDDIFKPQKVTIDTEEDDPIVDSLSYTKIRFDNVSNAQDIFNIDNISLEEGEIPEPQEKTKDDDKLTTSEKDMLKELEETSGDSEKLTTSEKDMLKELEETLIPKPSPPPPKKKGGAYNKIDEKINEIIKNKNINRDNCPDDITIEMLIEAMDVKGSIEREIYIKNKNKLWAAYYDVLLNPNRDVFGFKSEKIKGKYILRIPGKKITITPIKDNISNRNLFKKPSNKNLQLEMIPDLNLKLKEPVLSSAAAAGGCSNN